MFITTQPVIGRNTIVHEPALYHYICEGCECKMLLEQEGSIRCVNWHIYYQCLPKRYVKNEEWELYRSRDFFSEYDRKNNFWRDHTRYFNSVVTVLNNMRVREASPVEIKNLRLYQKKMGAASIEKEHAAAMLIIKNNFLRKIISNREEYDKKMMDTELRLICEKHKIFQDIKSKQDKDKNKVLASHQNLRVIHLMYADINKKADIKMSRAASKYSKLILKFDRYYAKMANRKNNKELAKANKLNLKKTEELYGNTYAYVLTPILKESDFDYKKQTETSKLEARNLINL